MEEKKLEVKEVIEWKKIKHVIVCLFGFNGISTFVGN